jgi:hypothetical protein
MSKASRKEARRAAARDEVARRRRQAEAESPLTRAQLDALLAHLSEAIDAGGHDGTFALTERWLLHQGIDASPVLAFLRGRRIDCDFQMLLDADPHQLFGPTPERLARMPIAREILAALIEHVDGACVRVGCDHTLRHTRAWLQERGLPVAATLTALLAQGGGCDCEAVLNVDLDRIYRAAPDERA